MKITEAHFRKQVEPVDMAAEVAAVAAKDDVRSFQPLPGPFVQQLAQFYPLVRNVAEIAQLPQMLKGDREMGFCPLFCPKMIDETCQLGLFPLALDVHRNVFVFGPKCHVERGITRLFPADKIEGLRICDDDEGNFRATQLPVSLKLARQCTIAVNQLSDISDVLDLIHRQHGENWMCERLRACIVHMLINSAEFRTKIVFVAVRDSQSGLLVACEFGYIVGDIYTSGTGAYCVSGAGSLQLRALAGLLQSALGVRIWDLGMVMDYKTTALGCTAIPRRQWLACVKHRVGLSGVTADVWSRLQQFTQRGPVPAVTFVQPVDVPAATPLCPPHPEGGGPHTLSKSQAKKAAKAQWLAEQKAKKKHTGSEAEDAAAPGEPGALPS
jgi:hypothetical protein